MRLMGLARKGAKLALKIGLSSMSLRGRKRKVSPVGLVDAKKRVVVLSQFYSPEPIMFPPAIAKAFESAGYQVSVVTGFPNRPNGKLYSDYHQRLNFSEKIDGIHVRRVPLVINYSKKALERIANFLTFSISALTATGTVRGADAVYVYATPATAAIPAQVWKKLLGIPYVLHVQDLWPESVTDSKMVGQGISSRLMAAMMTPWLKKLYSNAAQLIAISPGMRELLIERGNEPEKCSAVYNWAHESTITAKPRNSFRENGIRLLYAGNLGSMQDLKTVIEAARRCEDQRGFSLKIVGGGILKNDLQTAAARLSSTSVIGRMSRSRVSKLYLESDFQLVTLKDIPIFRTTIPSKLQASLAAGVPVITTVKGNVADLIQRHDAGLVAEPENVESLVAAFEKALNMSAHERGRMGKNARELYETHMSRLAGTSAIISIMDKVIGRARYGRSSGTY